jgi:hypothetical protein
MAGRCCVKRGSIAFAKSQLTMIGLLFASGASSSSSSPSSSHGNHATKWHLVTRLLGLPPAPILIERAGPSTRKKFFEFFTVPIRNAHTRAAYYRAIQQFLAWTERAGYQHLEDIEPITVAAYIETLQRQAHPDGRHVLFDRVSCQIPN